MPPSQEQALASLTSRPERAAAEARTLSSLRVSDVKQRLSLPFELWLLKTPKNQPVEVLAGFKILRTTKTYLDTLLELKVIIIEFYKFLLQWIIWWTISDAKESGAWSPTFIPEQYHRVGEHTGPGGTFAGIPEAVEFYRWRAWLVCSLATWKQASTRTPFQNYHTTLVMKSHFKISCFPFLEWDINVSIELSSFYYTMSFLYQEYVHIKTELIMICYFTVKETKCLSCLQVTVLCRWIGACSDLPPPPIP